MKIVTSMIFEFNLPEEEVKAYNSLSEHERLILIAEMKKNMKKIINSECVAEVDFKQMSVEVKEGE